jgi:hypothetical protein
MSKIEPRDVDSGIERLKLFGFHVPASEEQREALARELRSEVRASLDRQRIAALPRAPRASSDEVRSFMDLLLDLSEPASSVSDTLFILLLLKQVATSLEHGHTAASPYGYMAYAVLLVSTEGAYQEAYELGRAALLLSEELPRHGLPCQLHEMFGGHLVFYREPLRAARDYLTRACREGIAVGDLIYAPCAALHLGAVRLGSGDALKEVREEAEAGIELARRCNDPVATDFLTIARQMVAALEGRTRGHLTLDDDIFQEAAFSAATGASLAGHWLRIVKIELSVFGGDEQGGVSTALEADENPASAGAAYFLTEQSFYTCLALAAARAMDGSYAAVLARHRDRLAVWAACCPENFRHKQALVNAELARVGGAGEEALKLYDEAAEGAKKGGFIHHEALANELSAKLCIGIGLEAEARARLEAALNGYARWGALAKVRGLRETFASRLPQPA